MGLIFAGICTIAQLLCSILPMAVTLSGLETTRRLNGTCSSSGRFIYFCPPYSLYCGDSRVFRFIAYVGPGSRKPTFFFWGLLPVFLFQRANEQSE
jgi:hypothetical protein